MPAELQPKLLRALQEQEFERLGQLPDRSGQRAGAGGDKPGSFARLVDKKLFRADLFYRLNVIPICLPPLRERVQDISAADAVAFARQSSLPASTSPSIQFPIK